MIRDYGWRGGCLAAGVTDAGVGSGEWFGDMLSKPNCLQNPESALPSLL
jgi:hypothetical protein